MRLNGVNAAPDIASAPPSPFGARRLERIAGVNAHEGPVYVRDEHALYFTTVPQRDRDGRPVVAIKRLSLADRNVSVVRADAVAANGMTLGSDGALVVCQQGTLTEPAALVRVDRATGETTTIADSRMGTRLNSPNDVAVRSDGSLWFTDPSYGFLQGFRPPPRAGDAVCVFDPRTGDVRLVADSFDKPNGIAFSPDERVLYVTDSGSPHHVKAFDVDGHRLRNERLFAVVTPGFPDGLKTDSQGRVYTSFADGVRVFDPAGELLGEIPLPGAVNFTFGGSRLDVLYITADDAIWAAHPNSDVNHH